jgi:hypothetical protein
MPRKSLLVPGTAQEVVSANPGAAARTMANKSKARRFIGISSRRVREDYRPRDQGSGIREQGSGIRDQGTGNREQGTGIGGWRVTPSTVFSFFTDD